MGAPLQFQSLAASPFLSPLLNATFAASANPLNQLTTEDLTANNALSILLSNLTGQSQTLFNAAQPLLDILSPTNTQGGSSPVFQERVATSDKTTIAFANVFTGKPIGLHSLTVSQLAVAQENLGPALPNGSPSNITVGNDTFNVLQNGKTTPITVTIAGGDNNQTAINKVVNAVNQANLGLNAQEVTSGGSSQIQINATSTGTANGFTLIDRVGNAIFQTGANNTQIQAKDAVFTVDGNPTVSSTNTVGVDNGAFSLTLTGTSPNPASISINPNSQDIATAASNFLNAFNDLQSMLSSNLSFLPQVQGLTTRSIIGPQLESQLTSIGISVGAGGTLNFNQSTLTQALTSNFSGVQSALGGITGLAAQASKAAENMLQFPPSLFNISVGSTNTAPNLQILFLLNNSGILQPFISQKGVLVNTFT